MKQVRPITRSLFWEPLTWIFYCLFQPVRFRQEIEAASVRLRFVRMCQLICPILICIIPFALLTYFLLDPAILSSSVAIWAVLLTLFIAILIGTFFGLIYGITGAIAGAFWVMMLLNVYESDRNGKEISTLIAAGFASFIAGITVGILLGSATDFKRSSRVMGVLGNAVGMFIGIPMGILLGWLAGQLGSALLGNFKTLGRTFTIFSLNPNVTQKLIYSTFAVILGAVFASLFIGAFFNVLHHNVGARTFPAVITRILAVAPVACVTVSIIIGGLETYSSVWSIAIVILFIGYTLGYFRLPLYLVSGWSSLQVYLASRRNPSQVFARLHRSSLYWDECVFLPLPYLKRTLYLAIEQDIQQTLVEITFIVGNRPTQIAEARAAAMEIALRDLEERETLRHIAQASVHLADIFQQEAGLIDPRWVTSFSRLDDASREAARYMTQMSRQARRDALDEMILNLKRVSSHVYDEHVLNRRLQLIVKRWLAASQAELDGIARAPEEFGYLDNPYVSGVALKPHSQQFVGRHDLVRELEQALRKGENSPCFFLTGERRMGKTSTLNQLPVLLGTRYIPLVFDLQARGMSSNVAAFLSEIAGSTYKAMEIRAMRVSPLEYETLNQARRENEAMVYRLFDRWLDEVEAVLERKDRLLLIAFDEFEKLEEASQSHFLDIQLLLDWFRNVIQNRPRLALLFSGVKTPGEMDSKWAGHFVNVKTLRVSFLHPTDAYQLITRPVHDYPSERIFGEGVVEEIIRLSGCHPFLVQAMCSELIDRLNVDLRDRALVTDVGAVVDSVLESWGETYFRDVWERTDREQRLCLNALKTQEQLTFQQVCNHISLSEEKTQLALQTLCKRDLAQLVEGTYQVAVPIFRAWLERNGQHA